jgi:hypothetical protein
VIGNSRYMDEVIAFASLTSARAVYCFAVDGHKGTGGCPLVMGITPAAEYRALCEELIGLLRSSADMLQADIDRQVPLP